MAQQLSDKDQTLIGKYVSDHAQAYTVILFGSTAKGTMRSDSDVDIAFLSDITLSPYDLFMLAQGLAGILGREVDLIDFQQANSVFKVQIIDGGKLLLDQDPITRQYSFMRALKEYAQLNEERRGILVKLENIRRCLNRIAEVYGDQDENLMNYTKQDSIILNLQRACEACIDLAMHIVSERSLGVPQSSRDAFDMLYTQGIIDDAMNIRMKAMVGFRNIAVHDYQSIKVDILRSILNNHLSDFSRFIECIQSNRT